MVALEPIPKKAWLSKTVWANLVMAIVAMVSMWVPDVAKYVDSDNLLMMFSFINIILRAVTKDKIAFW